VRRREPGAGHPSDRVRPGAVLPVGSGPRAPASTRLGAGHVGGGCRRGHGSGGAGRPGGVPGAVAGPPPADRRPVGIRAGGRGRPRPDLQRPEVGQRAVRPRRRGGGAARRRGAPRRSVRSPGVSGAARPGHAAAHRHGAGGAAYERRPGGEVHPWGQPEPRPSSAHARRHGQSGARERRPLGCLRRAGAGRAHAGDVCALRRAPAPPIVPRPRCALDRRAGQEGGD
jgi:hypothetical protein